MQKSPTTSRMQSFCWVNYYRPVSITRFAAAVRAPPPPGGTCAPRQPAYTHVFSFPWGRMASRVGARRMLASQGR